MNHGRKMYSFEGKPVLGRRYKREKMACLSYVLCKRIVTEHTRGVDITEDIGTEFELILTRASTFVSPSDISS